MLNGRHYDVTRHYKKKIKKIKMAVLTGTAAVALMIGVRKGKTIARNIGLDQSGGQSVVQGVVIKRTDIERLIKSK